MRRRYLVEGEVQGVGFRFFARRTALGLGLAGWVRNLPGGRVEAEAEGTETALASFEDALARGPLLGRVARVDRSEISDEAEPATSFEIR